MFSIIRKYSYEIWTCRHIVSMMSTSGIIVIAIMQGIITIAILDMSNALNWDEAAKQDILGISFWGFSLSKIPSGRLSEIIGSKRVIGYSMLTASFLTILTPLMASWNFYVFLTSRILLGFSIGAFTPAVMPLAAKWIPPTEHSSFMACMSAHGLGIALAYLICGFLISEFGWASAFYATGLMSLIWTVMWFCLIYDSPLKHPRIRSKEKEEIMSKLQENSTNKNFFDLPWTKIITSGPVWAVIIGQTGLFFGYATLMNEVPLFLQQVLNFDLAEIGVFASLPFWAAYFVSIVFGYMADALQKSGKVSTVAIRNIFQTISFLPSAVMMVVLAIWGDIAAVALVSFSVTIAGGAAGSIGHCANILDIAPNFSGTIFGLTNTIGAFPVYFSTKIVAVLLNDDHSFRNWSYLFWILFGTYVTGNILFLILCSGTRQEWDSSENGKNKSQDHSDLQTVTAS